MRAVTKAFAAATSQELVTKIDLERVETKLMGEIAAVRTDLERVEARLEGEIAALRADLERTETRLTGEIAALRTEVEQKIAGLENRLLTRLGGMMAAGFGILGVLIAVFAG